MGGRGKEISIDKCEVLVRLKEHFDQEKKAGPVVSTKDSFGRTATALSVGVATVKRIVGRYKRTGTVLAPPRGKRGRRVQNSGHRVKFHFLSLDIEYHA